MPSLAIRDGDLCLEGGHFVTAPTLETEVIFTLSVDARDPSNEETPRGFWLDPNIGTLLWTRMSQPNTPETHRLIERDIQQGLAYLVTTGRATEVSVEAQRAKQAGEVDVNIVIRRGEEELLSLRFQNLWRELGFVTV